MCVCMQWFVFGFFFLVPIKNLPGIPKESGIFGTLVGLIVVLEFRKFLEMENNVAITASKNRAFGIQITLVFCPFQLSHIQGTFSSLPWLVLLFFLFIQLLFGKILNLLKS